MVAHRAMQIEIWQDGTHYLNIFEIDDGTGDLVGSACVIDRYVFNRENENSAYHAFFTGYRDIRRIKVEKDVEGAKAIGNSYNLICAGEDIWGKAMEIARAALEAAEEDSTEFPVEETIEYNKDGTRTVTLKFANHRAFTNLFQALGNSSLNPFMSQIEENLILAKEAIEEMEGDREAGR